MTQLDSRCGTRRLGDALTVCLQAKLTAADSRYDLLVEVPAAARLGPITIHEATISLMVSAPTFPTSVSLSFARSTPDNSAFVSPIIIANLKIFENCPLGKKRKD